MPVMETKAMTLRLPQDQAEELEAIALIEDRPVAEVVREAIASHIKKRRSDPRFQQKLRDALERNRRILARLKKGE
jgi:predicted DNA-binding protein